MKKNFKFKIQGSEYNVEIKDIESNIVKMEVNGTPYEVEIDKTIDKPIKPSVVVKPRPAISPSKPAAAKPAAGANAITAPLPGNIIQIFVKTGDTVKKGDKLLIIEAMKMENDILAEADGTVAEIKVQAGEAVLQGDTLITIN